MPGRNRSGTPIRSSPNDGTADDGYEPPADGIEGDDADQNERQDDEGRAALTIAVRP